MRTNGTREVIGRPDAPDREAVRHQLTHRQRELRRLGRTHPRRELQALLRDVDAAIARLDGGAFGVCDVCHEAVGDRHLAHDPLARCCSTHPTRSETARVGRDLALARDVQLGLLPPLGQPIDGWRYHYRYEAAREVGGDFCDLIPRASGRETLVLVGDVAGKGIAASILMSSLLATVRSLARLDLPTGELLARASDLFRESAPAEAYATAAVASLQPDGVVDLYSAGHWPPLVRRGPAAAPVPVDTSVPLGLFGGTRYLPTRVRLNAGETLLLFTDGAIDAENRRGEDYTRDRLAGSLAAACDDCLETLVAQCTRDVAQFQDGAPAFDDLVLFAVRPASYV